MLLNIPMANLKIITSSQPELLLLHEPDPFLDTVCLQDFQKLNPNASFLVNVQHFISSCYPKKLIFFVICAACDKGWLLEWQGLALNYIKIHIMKGYFFLILFKCYYQIRTSAINCFGYSCCMVIFINSISIKSKFLKSFSFYFCNLFSY